MTDRIIYFLKELPDKYILIIVLLIMLAVAMKFGAVEPREIWLLVRDITIAIISIAGYKRMTASTEINNPTIQTPSINPVEMNNNDITVQPKEETK